MTTPSAMAVPEDRPESGALPTANETQEMFTLQLANGHILEIDCDSAARMSQTLAEDFAAGSERSQLSVRLTGESTHALEEIFRWMDHHRSLDLAHLVMVDISGGEPVYELSEWNWAFIMNQDFEMLMDMIEIAKTLRMTQLLQIFDIVKYRRPEVQVELGPTAPFPAIRLRM